MEKNLNNLSTVATRGQVVIPKEIRSQLNIQPGDTLSFTMEGGSVRLERVVIKRPRSVSLDDLLRNFDHSEHAEDILVNIEPIGKERL